MRSLSVWLLGIGMVALAHAAPARDRVPVGEHTIEGRDSRDAEKEKAKARGEETKGSQDPPETRVTKEEELPGKGSADPRRDQENQLDPAVAARELKASGVLMSLKGRIRVRFQEEVRPLPGSGELAQILSDLRAIRGTAAYSEIRTRIAERMTTLADAGDERCMRFGHHVYLVDGPRLWVADPTKKELLDASSDAARRLLRKTLNEQVQISDARVQMFSAYADGDALVYVINDARIRVSKSQNELEITKLRAELQRQSGVAASLIFKRQPELTGDELRRITDTLYEVTAGLRDTDRRLFLEHDENATRKRAEAIRKIPGTAPISVLVDDGSFGTNDQGVVREVVALIPGAELVPVRLGEPIEQLKGSSAVIVTAHATENLKLLIEQGIKHNAFRDRPVYFVSCNSTITRDLATKMIKEGGALGVFHFKDTLTLERVRAMFEGVRLKLKDSSGDGSLFDVFDEAARNAGLRALFHVSLASSAHVRGIS